MSQFSLKWCDICKLGPSEILQHCHLKGDREHREFKRKFRNESKPIQCPLCDRKYPHLRSFKIHLRRRKKVQYQTLYKMLVKELHEQKRTQRARRLDKDGDSPKLSEKSSEACANEAIRDHYYKPKAQNQQEKVSYYGFIRQDELRNGWPSASWQQPSGLLAEFEY